MKIKNNGKKNNKNSIIKIHFLQLILKNPPLRIYSLEKYAFSYLIE